MDGPQALEATVPSKIEMFCVVVVIGIELEMVGLFLSCKLPFGNSTLKV